MSSKKAGVVIDSWKLGAFRKRLTDANFKFTEKEGPTPNTLLLQVEYEWVSALKPVIEMANADCVVKKVIS